MAQDARDMGGALLGETTFAAIGVVFLLSSIRTFTSSLYMSLYGNVPNETVGGIVLGVFAASILAALVGWRLRHRRAIALSGTLLAGGTVLATVVRWSWGDIVLSAVAVVGGTWWLTLAHSARPQGRTSPFVLGLPIAIAADLALRAGFRTVPVVDLAQPLSIALVALGALVFVAAGLASYEADRQWTSPGLRGALALIAIPPLILVGELAATNPIVAAVAGDAAKGPEGAGRWYLVAAAMGLAMTSGASSADRRLPAPRLFAIAALVLGAVLFWSRVPLAGTVGAVVMAMGLVIAATVLPDTAARPSGSPVVTAVALAIGWIVFVALAFLFYAYYALPAAAWIAVALVAVGVIAAVSLPGRRFGPVGIALIALLTVAVPVGALVTTPAAATPQPRSAFRLMTYNVHQGYDDGNVPSIDRIAEVIRAEDPDVVVLQEVARGWMITEQHDVLTVLSERLGMQYVFGPAIGEAYGNAVLSRLPIADVRYVQYPRQPQLRHQPRGAIFFHVADVLVIATHLDHIDGATEVRQGQVHTILSEWNNERPAIVVGDLNALPGSAEMVLLEGAGFRDLAKDDGADQPTSPAGDPRNRVDYVWGNGVSSSQAHTVATTASDHRPLVVNIARK